MMPKVHAAPKPRGPPHLAINPLRPLLGLRIYRTGFRLFIGYAGLATAFTFIVIFTFHKAWPTTPIVPVPAVNYQPIRVDRLRMEELGMYDQPEWLDVEWMHQPRHGDRHVMRHPTTSPLLVTALPETRQPKHKYVSNALADWRLCGRNDRSCQVLLAGSIGEQESKAQNHLQQIAVIARELNRTLILPNIHKSRFGTCSQNRFDMYYDVGSLQSLGVRVATYETFLEWCATRRTSPLAQVVEVVASEQQTAYQSTSWERCLWKAAPRIKWEQTTARFPIQGSRNFISSGKSIMDTFNNDLPMHLPSYPNVHDSDIPQIYALNWKLRHPVIPEVVDRYLAYSTKIVRYVDSLLDAAGPIAVVHWRMESVPPSNLVDCSKELVQTFEWISSQAKLEDIRLAYLATDYPLEDSATRHSGTFRDIGEQHHAAINIFRQAFQPGGPLDAYKLVSYFDLARLVPHDDNILETDPGYLGIIDKVMASRAEIFISGSSQCARNSSFTRQITTTRQKTQRHQTPFKVRNVGYVFGPR